MKIKIFFSNIFKTFCNKKRFIICYILLYVYKKLRDYQEKFQNFSQNKIFIIYQ